MRERGVQRLSVPYDSLDIVESHRHQSRRNQRPDRARHGRSDHTVAFHRPRWERGNRSDCGKLARGNV